MFKGKRFKLILEAVVIIILSVAVIITAANHKILKEDNDSQTEKSETVDKVFDIWYSDTAYEPFLKEAAARYESKTGITVKVTYYTNIDYLDRINKSSAEGKGPDLYIMTDSELQNAILLGIAEQNSNPDRYNDENYYNRSMEATVFVEKKYGYPLGFDTTVFMANSAYVDSMPETFDNVKSFADSFNDEDGTHDYSSVQSVLKWDISDVFYSYGFLGAYLNVGGSYGDNPKIIDVNNENAINAGKYYYSLAQYFYTEADMAKYDDVINDFLNGKIIYTIASEDIIKRLSESEVNVYMSPLPALSDTLETKAVSITDIVMVNPFADMKQEAREFAEFMTYDMAEEMYSICGRISARRLTYDNEYINSFTKAYEKSAGLPKFMTTSDYWLKVNEVLTDIWSGSDVEEKLNILYDELDKRIN